MSDYVRYIDRITDYYLSEGYPKPYAWAHFEDVPFTALKKPLSECRAALVSTGDVHARDPDADGEQVNPSRNVMVGGSYCIDTATPVEQLFSHQEHYDKYATHLDDVNSYFPVSRLLEKVEQGVLGSMAPRCHGVSTTYSQRKTTETDAPEVLLRLRQDEVDIAVLTPV